MTHHPVAAPGLLAFLLLATVSFGAVAEWHASDEHGVVREPISAEEVDDHEYAVLVERSGTQEVRTLFRTGDPVQRTELEFRDGVLWSRRFYVVGELTATEHFRYWADGSLRSVRHVGDRGATVEYRYRLGRLREEWVDAQTGAERIVFDELGRMEARTRWESGEVVERETREYWGDAPDDGPRLIVLVVDAEERASRYDEQGRLPGSITSRAGAVASDRTRVFEAGLLVEEQERSDGLLRSWRYEYEDSALARERYSENGALVKVTDYTDPYHSRIESIYRGEAIVLRVYFSGRDRIREEVMRDGEVLRTREFSPPVEGDR